MKMNIVRNFIFRTKLLVLASFAVRLLSILKFNLNNFYITFVWLIKKSEFTNYNYDLTALNKKYLAVFIAAVTNRSEDEVNKYFHELETDIDFNAYLKHKIKISPRGNELGQEFFFGRRLGWYALIRILQPEVVVETGTDKGFGTLVMAQALHKNGAGKIFTIDSDPFAGVLIDQNKWSNIELLRGNSIELLENFEKIDFFLHDSDHDPKYEYSEFVAIINKINSEALVLSDNSHVCDSLLRWSNKQYRKFAFFKEESLNHWHPGDGIGISFLQK